MSYYYKAKTDVELEQVADAIRKHFPKRRLGLVIDIEGILEDLGLKLLPRRGFRRHAEGYLARAQAAAAFGGDGAALAPAKVTAAPAARDCEQFRAVLLRNHRSLIVAA